VLLWRQQLSWRHRQWKEVASQEPQAQVQCCRKDQGQEEGGHVQRSLGELQYSMLPVIAISVATLTSLTCLCL